MEGWVGGEEACPAEMAYVQARWRTGPHFGGKGARMPYGMVKNQGGKKAGQQRTWKGAAKRKGKRKGTTSFSGQCYPCGEWDHSKNLCPHSETPPRESPEGGRGGGEGPTPSIMWNRASNKSAHLWGNSKSPPSVVLVSGIHGDNPAGLSHRTILPQPPHESL